MKVLISVLLPLLILSSCTKAKFTGIDESLVSESGTDSGLEPDSGQNDSGGGIQPGSGGTDGEGPAPGDGGSDNGGDNGGGDPNPPAKEWLARNCKPEELRKNPLLSIYSVGSRKGSVQQVAGGDLSYSNYSEFSIHQVIEANSLTIRDSAEVSVWQASAKKINIEAISLMQFHQIAANEIFLNTVNVFTDIHQVLAPTGANILIQSKSMKSAHQASAICARTESAKSVHQVLYAHVIGENNATVESIHQVHELQVTDASVDSIHQVGTVVLKNSHVRKVSTVGKLILINSTVDFIEQVGEITEK